MPLPRYLPRWAILLIDTALCLLALLAAYQLRFNFQVPVHEYDLLWPVLPVFLLVRAGSLFAARVHMAQVKHTSTEDARRIFLVVLAGSALFGLLSMARYYLIDGTYFLPRTVIIIDFMATAMLLIASRIAVKLLHLRARGSGKDEVRVLLYGAGAAGLITKRALDRDGAARYTVAAFLDDDAKKAGQRLEGVPIVRADKLVDLLKDGGIDQVIITVQHPDAENRRRVVDAAMAWHTQVLSVPPVHDWINGQLSSGQIREVRIEDLLGRATISLDDTLLKERFSGKCVLVTGAAGSIGSGIARQLITLGAGHTVLLDNAESDLYDLEMELRGLGHVDFTPVIADVRDRTALERVFAARKPAIVFHAAAYKHVPLMESWPEQAILTNVLGTRIVAELCIAHHVEECVLVSTDKAVNPTSVMGASKRIAEMVVGALGGSGNTRFVTTRFGNVLGSNGSVIPLFRKQIAAGGPVTVTDPEVTRFFMTIPEACRLVLEAAVMGKGGEILVFDMGAPVRIIDLAEKMIRLSGKEPVWAGEQPGPGRIAIAITGLRPGEKRFEELLASAENTLPTHHPRILIGRVRDVDATFVRHGVDALIAAAGLGDREGCLVELRKLVPEYAPQA
ncbi:MAG: polysaccharide biosynthesis protein [Bacteroidetes bacterium]|nr:polysaccharide biosynthesis protein [Bacteroidota bacterium]MCC6655721.1 polysaccharide biosynthesis protein [Flavobacteriales bacterium]HMU14979.1 nucleoside-diphosphate sugar epimerase/dehydratase [Flavobacteriales bacterium]